MTSSQTLLASLATRLSSHPENIATEALLHLLRQHIGAREAIKGLVRQAGVVDLPALTFQSQVTGDDGSIPDLIGCDQEGRARLVLEAKFWADLTPHQPNSYLQRLPKGVPSVLLFVCPESRQAVLWDKLAGRVPREWLAVAEAHAAGVVTWMTIRDDGHLAVTSWRAVLAAIEADAEARGDQGCRADVRQLQGLCERMDSEAFLPIRPGELSQEVGRRVSQMADLVDDTVAALGKDPNVSTRNLSTGGSHSAFGRYFRYGTLGVFLQYSPTLWSMTGVTPLWLSIKRIAESGWSPHPSAGEALRRMVLDRPSLFFEYEDQAYLGIQLLTGSEKADVVGDVVRQVLAACRVVVDEAERR